MDYHGRYEQWGRENEVGPEDSVRRVRECATAEITGTRSQLITGRSFVQFSGWAPTAFDGKPSSNADIHWTHYQN